MPLMQLIENKQLILITIINSFGYDTKYCPVL
jgi:hypothetical protein